MSPLIWPGTSGLRPACEEEPDHVEEDWTTEEWPDVDTAEWPADDEPLPVGIDDDHPDLNDLPDPWADDCLPKES